jgi:hydroxymethylbilane synthase
MCPAVGQGALAIETRDDGGAAYELARKLDHRETRVAVTAERALLATLGGGCQVPVGAHATVESNVVTLRAIVASPDGARLVKGDISGMDAAALGRVLGERLLQQGAREILDAVYSGAA